MADKKISSLANLASPAAGDLVPIVDISEPADADKNKTITWSQVPAGTVTSVTGGTGVSSTGGTTPSIALTVDELAEKTGAVVGTDRLVGTTGATNWAETISGIPLSIFNNDSNWNNYVLPAATNTVRGGIELEDATVQTTAANTVTTTASRSYGLQVNAAAQGIINVPWTDTISTLISLGVNATAAELNILDLSATALTAGWVYKATGASTAAWGVLTPALVGFTNGVDALTSGEVTQLATIGATVISAADWVAVSNLSGTNTGDDAVNTLYSGLVTNATHTGDVTGSGLLTIGAGAVEFGMLDTTFITAATAIASIASADSILINDSGVGIREGTFTQMVTYFNANLTFGQGTVTSVTGGTGVSSTGGTTPSIALTVDELAEKTGAVVGTDRLVGTTGTTNWAETISGIPLSIFNDDLGLASLYISIVTTPTTGNFPQLTAGGELINSIYDETSFATAAQGTLASNSLQKDGSVALTADWNVGAFDITVVDLTATGRVYVGNATVPNEFYLAGGGTTISINFDSADNLTFDRATDTYVFRAVGAKMLELSLSLADFWSVPVLSLGTIKGANTSPTETQAGVIELATQAETNTGTHDQRAVTPLKLANYSGNRLVDSIPDANQTSSGETMDMVADVLTAFGQVFFLDATATSELDKAQANAAATMPVFAMAIAVIAASATGKFLRRGFVRNDAWTWTPGGVIYASDTALAGMTQTIPATSGDLVQILGYATHADRMYFDPSPNVIEIG